MEATTHKNKKPLNTIITKVYEDIETLPFKEEMKRVMIMFVLGEILTVRGNNVTLNKPYLGIQKASSLDSIYSKTHNSQEITQG